MRRRARRIAVGKRCGQLSTAQHFINKQIVDAALEHDVVVRLKGGDPMLFGRADEEMRALGSGGHRVRGGARDYRGAGQRGVAQALADAARRVAQRRAGYVQPRAGLRRDSRAGERGFARVLYGPR